MGCTKIIYDLLPEKLFMGYGEEQLSRTLTFDISQMQAELPGGVPMIAYMRPRDELGYLASGVTLEGSTLTWELSAHVMQYKGIGGAQIVLVDESGEETHILKSHVMQMLIGSSIPLTGGEPPEPWETWLEQILAAAARAESAAADAEAQADRAETAEAGAQQALIDAGSPVLYGRAQTLTDAQQQTARGNIAAASAADVSDLMSVLEANIDDITTGCFHPVMEVGDYDIISGQLVAKNRKYYVRTKVNHNIHLHKGDIISLTVYTGYSFFVNVKRDGETNFSSLGRKSAEYTIPYDGEYAFVVGAYPIDTSVTYISPDDIGTRLYIRDKKSINDRIKSLEAFDDNLLIQSKNLLTAFSNSSINSDTGTWAEQDTGKRYASTEEMFPVDPNKKYSISWNDPDVLPSYAFLFEYTSAKAFIKRVSFSVFNYRNNYLYEPDDNTIAYVRIMLVGDSSTNYEDLIPSEMQFEAGPRITCYTERKALNPVLFDPDVQYRRLVNDKSLRYDFSVPDYYTDSGYMVSKVNAINAYMDSCYATGDCFAFITDAHWGAYNAQNSPALIRYLYDRTSMSKVFDGGDTGNGGDVNDTIMDYCQAIQACIWNRAYFAVGNHEPFGNVASSYISARFDSRREKYNGNPEQHYYYIDNERAKIRYVILACYETGDGNNAFNGIGGNSEASAAQRAWFQNVALNVETGWAVVIVMHSLYYVSNISPYPLVAEPRYDSTIAIMDNFVNNGGEICCVLQGHTHIDRMTHTPAGIPVFITTCDKYYDNETPAGIIVPRPKDTIREQAFDVVCINRETKTVRLIRIGCPAQNGMDDNVGVEAEYREMSWSDEGN